MPARLRRNFSGAFLPQNRGNGTWQLSSPAPHEINVFLRDAERGAERSFGTGPLIDLGIEWHAKKVLLTFMAQEKVASVEAANAIVHEPLGQLYERLPLISIDADARRFWRRIFRLVRIPGGRFLLKLLARSRRR
jgi:hypothetical protein